MKRILLAAAMAAVSFPALAADLQLKAAPIAPLPSFLGPYTGSGFYAGMNFGGAAGTVDATVVGTTGSQKFTQMNGNMGLTVGYAWALGNSSWAAIEGDFDAMAQSGNTLAGLSLNSPMAFDQRVIYGGGVFDQLLKVLGGVINIGTIPPFQGQTPNSTAINSSMYGFLGLSERDISGNFGAASNKVWDISAKMGVGLRTQYANGFATDASMFARLGNKSLCVGAPTGTACANENPEAGVEFKLLY